MLKNAYKALVRPQIKYVSTVWNPRTSTATFSYKIFSYSTLNRLDINMYCDTLIRVIQTLRVLTTNGLKVMACDRSQQDIL